MTDRDLEVRERLFEERLTLLEERVDRSRVPLSAGLAIVLAVTVAATLMMATAFSGLLESAQREPVWTVLLSTLLVIAALGTTFAIRAANRIGEDGERLHLRAKALSEKLGRPIV